MTKNWHSFSVTHVGKKRKVNQDAIFVDDQQKIWVVADGMGGHLEGDKASRSIIAALSEITFSDVMSERIITIEKVLRRLNDSLQKYSLNDLNGQHIGSTIVLATVCQGICAIIWAGDSRCYRLNNNNITQLSWDHSYVDEMLRSGHIMPEEAATSKLSNIITRAVGAHPELFFDHVLIPYSDTDTFLLCSDGLTNELSDPIINQLVNFQGCSQNSLDSLLENTLEHGARDNVSIILISSRNRRPYNEQESKLIATYSKQLNTIAKAAIGKDIELDTYYQKVTNVLSQTISSHNIFIGQAKMETASVETSELPTANYPKVATGNELKSGLDINYFLFLGTMISLVILLVYFLLN